jgi:hypothetical protein
VIIITEVAVFSLPVATFKLACTIHPTTKSYNFDKIIGEVQNGSHKGRPCAGGYASHNLLV